MPSENTRGRAVHNWAEVIRDLCIEADLTIQVPANLPVHVAQLYETLGVAVEVDPGMEPWVEVKPGNRRKP